MLYNHFDFYVMLNFICCLIPADRIVSAAFSCGKMQQKKFKDADEAGLHLTILFDIQTQEGTETTYLCDDATC